MLLPVSHGSEASCNQADSLQGMLGQLKSAAERIVHNETLQVSSVARLTHTPQTLFLSLTHAHTHTWKQYLKQ